MMLEGEVEEGVFGLVATILEAHAFTFEGDVVDLLVQTSAPVPEHLPFPACFLDVGFDLEGGKVEGIRVFTMPGDDGLEVEAMAHYRGAVSNPYEMPSLVHVSVTTGASAAVIPGLGVRRSVRVNRAVSDFVRSWAALVTDPDVRLIESARSPGARRRIERDHGASPPGLHAVRLSPVMRRYIQAQKEAADRLKREGVRAHWVRGHFRTLRSKRFKAARNQTIWVPPHLRGTGPMIRSSYEVTA